MTTNDATPRERIARAMTSGFSRRAWDGEFNPSTDPVYNKTVRDHVRADFLGDADAMIAHLWEQVDSYDFFDALETWVLSNENYEPDEIARFTVEYLIGPKPEEMK